MHSTALHTYTIAAVELEGLANVVALQVEGEEGEGPVVEAVVLNTLVLGEVHHPGAVSVQLMALGIA